MDNQSKNIAVGFFLTLLLVGGIILLTTRRPIASSGRFSQKASNVKHFPLIEDIPLPAKRYQNLEQWHVKWSPDGDECWVDIKRDATQS